MCCVARVGGKAAGRHHTDCRTGHGASGGKGAGARSWDQPGHYLGDQAVQVVVFSEDAHFDEAGPDLVCVQGAALVLVEHCEELAPPPKHARRELLALAPRVDLLLQLRLWFGRWMDGR